jgi:hypothetical protein
MDRLSRLDHLGGFKWDMLAVQVSEQWRAAAEQYGHEVNRDFVIARCIEI